MAQPKHLHRYRRKGKTKLFFCTKQDCFHRMDAEYLISKHAECTFCGGEYTLTKDALRRVIPRCQACTKGTKARLVGDAMSVINAFIKENERKEEEDVSNRQMGRHFLESAYPQEDTPSSETGRAEGFAQEMGME